MFNFFHRMKPQLNRKNADLQTFLKFYFLAKFGSPNGLHKKMTTVIRVYFHLIHKSAFGLWIPNHQLMNSECTVRCIIICSVSLPSTVQGWASVEDCHVKIRKGMEFTDRGQHGKSASHPDGATANVRNYWRSVRWDNNRTKLVEKCVRELRGHALCFMIS